jgi:ubiquinone/menaquinone biosynthesis C-methylase UbiE
LNAAVTRETYRGEKASSYDFNRDQEAKWRREHDAVTEFLQGAAGTVLDIPVGTGRFLSLYHNLGLEVIGFDVSDEMLAQAREKDASARLDQGDIFGIPLPDKSVDTAVCVRLLNLITEDEMVMAIKELGRVTRDRIILSIRTGDAIGRKTRSWTHRDKVFRDAVEATGMYVRAARMAHKNNYNVVLITP